MDTQREGMADGAIDLDAIRLAFEIRDGSMISIIRYFLGDEACTSASVSRNWYC